MKTFSKTILMASALMIMGSGASYADSTNIDYNARESHRMDDKMHKDHRTTHDHKMMKEKRVMNDRYMNKREAMQNTNVQYYSMSRPDVMDVQQSLNNQGYTLEVDGIWGDNTDRAIRAFQSRHSDLRATGDLDQRTLAELNVNVNGTRDR